MPITPLHYSVVYPLKKILRDKIRFPGLIVGCFTPDLEIPFIYLFTRAIGIGPYDRLILHSIIGGLIFGTLIALLLTRFLYVPVVRFFTDVRENDYEYTKVNFKQVVSAVIGVESHVFIDSLHHPYNPLLWPFSLENVSIFLISQNIFFASIIVHIITGIVFLSIFAYHVITKNYRELFF